MSDTESNTKNQVYELSYLLLPSIPEENLSEVVTKIEQVIESKGGQKIDGEAPYLRELAYEMTKVVGASRYLVKNAYIGWVKFDLPAEVSTEEGLHPAEAIKAEVETMNEVLRMLLVKAEMETKFTFASTMEPKEEEVSEIAEDSEVSEASDDIEDEEPDSIDEPEDDTDTVVK